MAALNELYLEIKEDSRKKRRRPGPPPDLSEYEQFLWERASMRPYGLLDDDGRFITNHEGKPVRFTAGDKEFVISDEDFEMQVRKFWDMETPGQYRERLRKHGLKV